jgi:uncharacterized protein YbjT (DUF2867 family)
MASRRTALLAGGTGLTGSHLLSLLLADSRYTHIHALVRKPGLHSHARLQEQVFDFDHPTTLSAIDDVFCCLGTTIKKAGSPAAFRKVDFDYVVSLAQLAGKAGVKRFMVISSLGANANSPVFYCRVKGEMENAMRDIGFDELHIFQPSLLLGNRRESRVAERVGIAASSLISPFMFGPMRKYRPIDAHTVANAMLRAAWAQHRGNHVYTSEQIVELAG